MRNSRFGKSETDGEVPRTNFSGTVGSKLCVTPLEDFRVGDVQCAQNNTIKPIHISSGAAQN